MYFFFFFFFYHDCVLCVVHEYSPHFHLEMWALRRKITHIKSHKASSRTFGVKCQLIDRTSIYFGLMIHWPYLKWTSTTVTIFVWQIIRKSIMCPLSCHLKISPGVPGSPGNPSSPLSPLGPAECPLVIDSYAQIHRHWDNICVGKLALIHIYSRVTQQKKQVNIRKLICKVKSHNQRLW